MKNFSEEEVNNLRNGLHLSYNTLKLILDTSGDMVNETKGSRAAKINTVAYEALIKLERYCKVDEDRRDN